MAEQHPPWHDLNQAATPVGAAIPRTAEFPTPSIFIAVALYYLDAFVLGQGFIAIASLIAVVIWLLPKMVLLVRARQRATRGAYNVVIFAVLTAAVMLTININGEMAQTRADRLVDRIEMFRAMNGRYPLQLGELVPRYMERIPPAKHTLAFNKFIYLKDDDRVMLMYVDVPPFDRNTYDFVNRRWID